MSDHCIDLNCSTNCCDIFGVCPVDVAGCFYRYGMIGATDITDSESPAGKIAGIVVGVVIMVAIAICTIIACYNCQQKNSPTYNTYHPPAQTTQPTPATTFRQEPIIITNIVGPTFGGPPQAAVPPVSRVVPRTGPPYSNHGEYGVPQAF